MKIRRVAMAAPLLAIGRDGLLTAFGRAIAEVGATVIVGCNIRGFTRTMTTAIALETSRGDLNLALGIVLIALSMALSAVSFYLSEAMKES